MGAEVHMAAKPHPNRPFPALNRCPRRSVKRRPGIVPLAPTVALLTFGSAPALAGTGGVVLGAGDDLGVGDSAHIFNAATSATPTSDFSYSSGGSQARSGARLPGLLRTGDDAVVGTSERPTARPFAQNRSA